MDERYNHIETEARVRELWEKEPYFTPRIDPKKRPFSIFFMPPNASGGMHIGNMFMIAMQDVLARFNRAEGTPTLWVPGTDHGGYETQVTFERELERQGKSRFEYTNRALFSEIERFVASNNDLIRRQIKVMGASVDWSRFRYTMDEQSLNSVFTVFRKMVADGLVYRRPYIINYCASCGTVLADIELSEKAGSLPRYEITCDVEGGGKSVLVTARPEFLFAVTHVLAHPEHPTHKDLIGKTLINPLTKAPILVVPSKRKFKPEEKDLPLTPFSPAHDNYDYGYAMRYGLPAKNLLDWNGCLIERYPGLAPEAARKKEIDLLMAEGRGTRLEHAEPAFCCKRGHEAGKMIALSWFLKMDDEKTPLRQIALEAMRRERPMIFPRWREKGLLEWIGKMYDWPFSRQNVWGIRVPVWYDVSDPALFTVWFIDSAGKKQVGSLKTFLDARVPFDEIERGLERVYAHEGVTWTLEKEEGKHYLPETDTFDTWFSSAQWGNIAYGEIGSRDLEYFYPSHSILTAHDLLRLFIARTAFLCTYVTGRLPFKMVYLHRLIKGRDGQKMSKSLGNAVTPEEYLQKYGADVTRLALVSYAEAKDDFILEDERVQWYENFRERLWEIGKIVALANEFAPDLSKVRLTPPQRELFSALDGTIRSVKFSIEKFSLARGQESACSFLSEIERYAYAMKSQQSLPDSLAVLRRAFILYLMCLHPFMPFMTEELYGKLYEAATPLAATTWDDVLRS